METTTIALLTEDADASLTAEVSDDDVWITAPDLTRATGWKLTRDGFCHGSLCIPIPPGRDAEFTRTDGSSFFSLFGSSFLCFRFLDEGLTGLDEGLSGFDKVTLLSRHASIVGAGPIHMDPK